MTSPRRLPNWFVALDAAIQEKAEQPFAWGVNDCCLFACDLVLAMTGVDYAKDFRGRYGSPLGAARTLREVAGVATLPELLDKLAASEPWEEVAPIAAGTGDWTLADGSHGPTLGIRFGGFIALPEERGVGLIPWTRSMRAWVL